MTVEEALEIAQRVSEQGRLSKVQELVFRHSWERKSYLEIAKSSAYEVGYIRDVGYKLWQLLSKAFGKKVTKNNFYKILNQQHAVTDAGRQACFVCTKEVQQSQESVPKLLTTKGTTVNHCQDWGEAIDVSIFYGYAAELAALKQWVVQDRCRLVAILGMGGVGKTALAVKVAEQVQDQFKYIIWRSLRNAPPIQDLLTELIVFLSGQQQVNLPETVDSLICRLMEYLRSSRCLLLLDNAESLLSSGERAGRYRSGYEGYGQLLRRVRDERHQSCLVLTSREKPIGLTAMEGKTLPVRSLQLTGLQQAAAQEILNAKGLVEVKDEFSKLIERYNGNPLALKIVATTIQSLFDGDVSKFLNQVTVVFGDIWDLLDQQFNRLSPLEKQVMYCLATTRESVTLPELLECIVPQASERELLEALESLQQRSLLDKHSVSFSQQLVIKKYVIERFKQLEGLSSEQLVRC